MNVFWFENKKTPQTSDWKGIGRDYPYLLDEDFDETSPNSWHWLNEEEVEFDDEPRIEDNWKKINQWDYFKSAEIPQWQAELKTIEAQYEAKIVEMNKPNYWFSYNF